MNSLDNQYKKLLESILEYGIEKSDRTGTGTKSIFGYTIRHNMKDGFPLLTTKKMAVKTMMTELKWFLKGDTNIKYLVDNNCHIWDGDCYKSFKNTFSPMIGIQSSLPSQEEFINKIKTDDEFAKKWGELGPIYGAQWRKWKGNQFPFGTGIDNKDTIYFDQIQNLIKELKTNPDSRRLMVNAWNVGELDKMVLPPCHYGFQVYTRELSLKEQAEDYNRTLENQNYNPKWQSKIKDIDKLSEYELMTILQSLPVRTRAISLMWNQRSVDTALGLPFNIASYALLLEIIGKIVNMVPDELIGNLGDTHLYSNHLDGAKEQIGFELSFDERVVLANKPEMIDDKYYTDSAISELTQLLDENNIPTRTREPFPLPTLKHLRSDDKYTLLTEFPSLWSEIKLSDFKIENYQSHSKIDFPLSN